MQIVVGLSMPTKAAAKRVEDVTYVADDEFAGHPFLCYGLVRDINFSEGLRVITSDPEKLQEASVLRVVNPKLFSLASNYILRDDLQEEILARKPDSMSHVLADLLP